MRIWANTQLFFRCAFPFAGYSISHRPPGVIALCSPVLYKNYSFSVRSRARRARQKKACTRLSHVHALRFVLFVSPAVQKPYPGHSEAYKLYGPPGPAAMPRQDGIGIRSDGIPVLPCKGRPGVSCPTLRVHIHVQLPVFYRPVCQLVLAGKRLSAQCTAQKKCFPILFHGDFYQCRSSSNRTTRQVISSACSPTKVSSPSRMHAVKKPESRAPFHLRQRRQDGAVTTEHQAAQTRRRAGNRCIPAARQLAAGVLFDASFFTARCTPRWPARAPSAPRRPARARPPRP